MPFVCFISRLKAFDSAARIISILQRVSLAVWAKKVVFLSVDSKASTSRRAYHFHSMLVDNDSQ